MKAITGAFKVFNLVGRLQCGKLKTELPAKSWLNASGFPRFKEQAKPFVPKAWLADTSARPVATEWVSADWVGREP